MTKRMLSLSILTGLLLATTILLQHPVEVMAATDVTISTLAFDPVTRVMVQGDTVTWKNNDPVIHTLWFTDASDGSTVALSDPVPPDGTWSAVFSSPANIRYYDLDRLWI